MHGDYETTAPIITSLSNICFIIAVVILSFSEVVLVRIDQNAAKAKGLQGDGGLEGPGKGRGQEGIT